MILLGRGHNTQPRLEESLSIRLVSAARASQPSSIFGSIGEAMMRGEWEEVGPDDEKSIK